MLRRVCNCHPKVFTPEGYSLPVQYGGQITLEPQESDVIGFESAPNDEHGAHAPVLTSSTAAAFPPDTIYRLKEIKAAGEWEAPNGIWPNQRLLVVTATYQPTHRAGRASRV